MDSLGEDILRPISKDELLGLLDLYARSSQETSYHYFSIYNQIKWNQQLKNVTDNESEKWNRFRREFYIHRSGNLQLNGTYVSIIREIVTSISFHTLETSMAELMECLEKTERIDWRAGPLIEGVQVRLAPFALEILCKRNALIEHDRLSLYFFLRKEKLDMLPIVRIPEGYEIRSLDGRDADKIYSVWPNKKEASVEFLRGMITLNKSLGIFKSDNSDLCAWVLQNEFGGLGVLQTMPHEQQKGFATILASEMCKEIIKSDGIPVTAFTTSINVKSQTLLKKIGFEILDYGKWTKYKDLVNL